jgi:hypothetical protein
VTERAHSILRVRALQERAARAVPAEHVERVGGWWLRRSATSSWWTGSVLPHGDAGRDELARMTALRLYAGTCFTEVRGYHYRTESPSPQRDASHDGSP